MRLVNDTPVLATFVPNAEADDTIVALLVAALTCSIGEEGELTVAEKQRPLILGPDALVPDDVQFYREGVSVTATGFVYFDAGENKASTKLKVGAVEHRLLAFGPRVWQASIAGGLSQSRPRPVPRVEMSWEHTYGGTIAEPASMITVDGQPSFVAAHENGYPLNMDGTGFYMKRDQAEEKPLPMLEHPDDLVKKWDDRTEPFCFAPYPLWGPLRAKYAWDPGQKQVDLSRLPRITGRACPALTFDEAPPGTEIVLEGMRPSGETLSFRVPQSPLYAEVEIGDAFQTVTFLLDAIDIHAEEREVRFVFRRLFRYGLVQMEPRETRFLPTAELDELIAGSSKKSPPPAARPQ